MLHYILVSEQCFGLLRSGCSFKRWSLRRLLARLALIPVCDIAFLVDQPEHLNRLALSALQETNLRMATKYGNFSVVLSS